MTDINTLICSAVSPVVAEVHEGLYTGAADEYVNFTYYSRGTLYSDGTPSAEIYRVTLSYFARTGKNVRDRRRRLRRAIAGAGFTYPSEMNATDTSKGGDGWQQYVYECEIDGETVI